MERFAIKIDKSLRANLYKICRLCGIDNPDKIKVLDDTNIVNLEDGEPELWKKVFDCIGLMITKDDKMPQFMCTLCVDKINDFFEFREMCYATDVQTRKLLGIKKETKTKALPVSSVDIKSEDIKVPIPELTSLRAGRKRKCNEIDTSKDIKPEDLEDIKPSSTTNPTINNSTKKKRMKLNNSQLETEAKIEPGTSKPKVEPTSKIPLSKKRLKTEPVIKDNKKDLKTTKLTKLMKKKLKSEDPSAEELNPEQQLQQLNKKKKELIKLKKLPQLVVKAEKLKNTNHRETTKIKEETSTAETESEPLMLAKNKSKLKEKCKICNEGFVNKIQLDKHVKTTHIPTVHRYHCVQCNETLKKNMEIKNHNLWHKLSKTPFQCGNCTEACCSIYTYNKHIRDCNLITYLDSHIPDWHCPDCNDNFETTYLFNIHSCVSKGLVCPGCDKPHKWTEDYLKHIPTCTAAFHRIPSYMTSNIQVKNEAELPTSPIPPPNHNTQILPTTGTSITVQSPVATKITPPLMDSNQCVVIPGNLSLHEETGSASPSKSSRKGKRITKKDLKRFDELLKSTMTTLVSIKHEPSQGVEEPAVKHGDQISSTETEEQSGSPPDSCPGSPMACGGDDFHHDSDDSESAIEKTPAKPIGTIKQEIIDEGYRDLYNNIEVNIKHEVEVSKNVAANSATPKPILKLKITKEHGTLNSILMDSPVSEKKKKKKKRKEDRVRSPGIPAISIEKNIPVESNTSTLEQTSTLPETNNELAIPLPEVITIKKEKDETEKTSASQNTPSIVAASSGCLQISSVSEGVTFHRPEENNDEEMSTQNPSHQQENISTFEESTNWAEPIPSMELSLNAMSLAPELTTSSSLTHTHNQTQLSMNQETEEEEEIDVKPCLEDLIPILQIASVTSEAEVFTKPNKTPVKRKRRSTVAKSNQIPKIVSVSSGTEVASYHPDSEADNEKNQANNNVDVFDFSQVNVKEEVLDPTYDEASNEMSQNHKEDDDIDEGEEDGEEEEDDDETNDLTPLSKKQAEEMAYIANIDFKNLTIKQEKEYIDDGLTNSVAFEENDADDDDIDADNDNDDDDEAEEEEEDSESEDESSDDDSDKSNSESEREYRDLPSENDESDKDDEDKPAPSNISQIKLSQINSSASSKPAMGLQILTVHSEFSCPEKSTNKTDSEEMNLNQTVERENINEEQQNNRVQGISMDVDSDESWSKLNEQSKLINSENDDKTSEQMEGRSSKPLEVQASVSKLVNCLDHQESTSETCVESPNLDVCNFPSSSNDKQHVSIPSQKTTLASNTLDLQSQISNHSIARFDRSLNDNNSTQEVPAIQLSDTQQSCQETGEQQAQQNSIPISPSVQSCSHLPNTLNPDLSTPQTNSNDDNGHSSGLGRPEVQLNSQLSNSSDVFNIASSLPAEVDLQESTYSTSFKCNADQSPNITTSQNPTTAGQLHSTSLVHSSNNSLNNLSELSEEVQNLLNEETVSVNNFEYNDSVLSARAASVVAPAINPAPVVFNDFENLNEIAENNNNANIEREALQDELANIPAGVFANPSNNDDDVDENNIMNENRANFDIT